MWVAGRGRVRTLLAAITALAAFSGLPEAHVHLAGPEGTAPIVHRHVLPPAVPEGSAAIDHGDHAKALFLQDSFDSTSRNSPVALLLTSDGPAASAPRVADRSPLQSIPARAHDPPLLDADCPRPPPHPARGIL
jgi:hypothetical protein